MAKTKTSWTKGMSGNPSGRKAGTGRVEEYRALLEPDVPEMLKVLADKAKEGDMVAIRLVLERVYPVRDAVLSDLVADLAELRALIEAKAPAEDADVASLMAEVQTLRERLGERGAH